MPDDWEVTNDLFKNVLDYFSPKSEGTNTQETSNNDLKTDSEDAYR